MLSVPVHIYNIILPNQKRSVYQRHADKTDVSGKLEVVSPSMSKRVTRHELECHLGKAFISVLFIMHTKNIF